MPTCLQPTFMLFPNWYRPSQRAYQTFAHPQLFRQTVQLTDGSTVRLVTISSQKPFVKLGIDSLSHPTWNPQLRNKLLLSEDAQVTKFKDRFANTANETLLGEFDGLLGHLLKDIPKEKIVKKAFTKK